MGWVERIRKNIHFSSLIREIPDEVWIWEKEIVNQLVGKDRPYLEEDLPEVERIRMLADEVFAGRDPKLRPFIGIINADMLGSELYKSHAGLRFKTVEGGRLIVLNVLETRKMSQAGLKFVIAHETGEMYRTQRSRIDAILGNDRYKENHLLCWMNHYLEGMNNLRGHLNSLLPYLSMGFASSASVIALVSSAMAIFSPLIIYDFLVSADAKKLEYMADDFAADLIGKEAATKALSETVEREFTEDENFRLLVSHFDFLADHPASIKRLERQMNREQGPSPWASR